MSGSSTREYPVVLMKLDTRVRIEPGDLVIEARPERIEAINRFANKMLKRISEETVIRWPSRLAASNMTI